MEKLLFEEPSIKRKKEAIEYIQEHYDCNSRINGSGGLYKYIDNYEEWLKKLENDKKGGLSEEIVPGLTYFLVREQDNKIVGMINIRLRLNERLKKSGGHIGYGIRPTERRKGYNKVNLYLGLKVLKKYGIKEAMLSCNKENLGSSKTMLALGTVKKNEFYDEKNEVIIENYIIDVEKSIEEYKSVYEKHCK